MTALAVMLAGALLAATNGANDVSKGVATLVAAGLAKERTALLWGSAWTALGGLAAGGFALAMVQVFGAGLLAGGAPPSLGSALAALLGAGAWVLVATRQGWPVSTTHAIVGAVVGVAAFAQGAGAVRWAAVAGKIAAPLALSPLVALALTFAASRAWRRWASPGDCVCVTVEAVPAALPVSGAAMATARLRVVAATASECAAEHPRAARLTVDHLHWLTSGLTSFARGMNDAPKMAALVLSAAALGAAPLGAPAAFALVTLGMVAGGLLGGRRITAVLAHRVTHLDGHAGFAANLVTAGLAIAGAVFGLPMSTTHLAAGAIVGAGDGLDRSVARSMLFAWLVTAPAAAALGVGAFLALGAA